MNSAKYSGLDFKVPPFAADPRDTAAQRLTWRRTLKRISSRTSMPGCLKTLHDIAPNLIVNTASAGMRLLMKLKDAPVTEGNILRASKDPHEIYGETILPVGWKARKD